MLFVPVQNGSDVISVQSSWPWALQQSFKQTIKIQENAFYKSGDHVNPPQNKIVLFGTPSSDKVAAVIPAVEVEVLMQLIRCYKL